MNDETENENGKKSIQGASILEGQRVREPKRDKVYKLFNSSTLHAHDNKRNYENPNKGNGMNRIIKFIYKSESVE